MLLAQRTGPSRQRGSARLPVSGWVWSLSNFLPGTARMSASLRSWQRYWIGSHGRTSLLHLTIITNSAYIEIIVTRASGNVTKGMRLVRLRAPGGLENLELVEEDQPKPRPGELLVRISIGSRADQEDMIRAITANRLKPVIDRTFPLQEIVAAFKYYESQKHFGKVCLEL